MYQCERIIPHKRMKRFLKEYVNGDVSRDAVEYLQLVLENQLKEICRNVIIEHEKMNSLRRFHRLPELKRFGIFEFKKVLDEVYISPHPLDNLGEVAKSVKPTTLSDKADIEVT